MSWSDSRTVSLDGYAAAGSLTPPIAITSFDRSPRIRSFTVINQSNVACGVFIQFAAGAPMIAVPAGGFYSGPIGPTDTVAFAWSQAAGGKQQGSCYVAVTEDLLAAASGAVPIASGAVFVLDISQLDGAAQIQ